MVRQLLSRRRVYSLLVTGIVAVTIMGGALALTPASAASGGYVALPNSAAPAAKVGQYRSHHAANDQITFGLMLQGTHQSELANLLKGLANPKDARYHQWLTPAQFEAQFGPSSSAIASATAFLRQQGFSLQPSPSSSLILAAGSAAQIERAFHTTLNDYTTKTGAFFANSQPVSVPSNLVGVVAAVAGLSDVPLYASLSQQDNSSVANKDYGGGPYGRGLTPSQVAGLYNIDPVYNNLSDRAQHTTLAVFELSGYKKSDIYHYENKFGLPNVNPINRPVLGGPQPVQLGGSPDYAAGEVELDIELQVAVATNTTKVLVYESPNTELGSLAQYAQIAKDNEADAISSSWGIPCEAVLNTQVTLAENNIFLQMAAQGQSMFAASGDFGAFGCTAFGLVAGDPALNLQASEPDNEPYVTAVGGTSFGSYNPGLTAHPTYHQEVVWNNGCTVANLCAGGAGGGGVSRFWASPDYQQGVGLPGFLPPGLIEAQSATQFGSSQFGSYCGQQTALILCRETPDISADADPATGYAIYCTDPGDAACNLATSPYTHNGWIRFGGTSCAAPVWAGIAALDISHNKGRLGNFGYLVYPTEFNISTFSKEFHDITKGDNGEVTVNGKLVPAYPAGPGYDMSTGNGTPNVYNLVKAGGI